MHSGVNRSHRLHSKQVFTSVTHFFSCSQCLCWWNLLVAFYFWIWTTEEKTGHCSVWKYSENYKLRNLLLGDTKQWKSEGCIHHHCCPTHSAVSSVAVPHVMGHREHWEGTGLSSHIACSSQPLQFVLHHANSSNVCKTLHSEQVCSDAERVSLAPPPSALPEPEEQQGGPCGWCPSGPAPRSDVQLEGGPLHCKRVSSRSHSEPVSFPAVSCHSWWHQSKRDVGSLAGVCWGRGGVVLMKGSSCFKGINGSSGFGDFFKFFFLSCWLSVSLAHTSPHRVGVSNSNSKVCVRCCFPVGLAITDVPGRTKHSSFSLGLAETLLNGKAGSLRRHWCESLLRCKSRAQTWDVNKTYGVIQPVNLSL